MTKDRATQPNSPHPGPSPHVDRDEPNRRGGAAQGNRGADKVADKAGAGTFADDPVDAADLARGPAPKPDKRYGHAR